MFSVLESRTNVTEQKERILIENLISYKLKYKAKEARLILQSGKQIFCYLLLCTLFVHFFCTYVRVRTQLQILLFFFVLANNRKASGKFCKIWENCYLRFFSVLCHVNVCHSSRTQLRSFSNLRKSQGGQFFAIPCRTRLCYVLV